MRVAVIINPISGGRRRAAAVDRQRVAASWFAARSLHADIVVTTHPGHAAALAREVVQRGAERVIAWGGDGTANEVAGPLIGTGVVMGLVPAGSGDGLAHGLNLPSNLDEALRVAVGESVVALDVGWLGDRHFLNVGGFGFDAAVADLFQRRGPRGFAGYLLAGMTGLSRYRCQAYRLDLDGATSEAERFLVAFANGREYGNGFSVAPESDFSDGWLDAVVVGGGTTIRQIWRGRRFLLKKEMPTQGVTRIRVRHAVVMGADLLAHVDGEPFRPSSPVTVRVEQGALRLAAVRRATAEG